MSPILIILLITNCKPWYSVINTKCWPHIIWHSLIWGGGFWRESQRFYKTNKVHYEPFYPSGCVKTSLYLTETSQVVKRLMCSKKTKYSWGCMQITPTISTTSNVKDIWVDYHQCYLGWLLVHGTQFHNIDVGEEFLDFNKIWKEDLMVEMILWKLTILSWDDLWFYFCLILAYMSTSWTHITILVDYHNTCETLHFFRFETRIPFL